MCSIYYNLQSFTHIGYTIEAQLQNRMRHNINHTFDTCIFYEIYIIFFSYIRYHIQRECHHLDTGLSRDVFCV